MSNTQQLTNLRVTNKMVLPVNTNLATINGQSLIELRESVNISIIGLTDGDKGDITVSGGGTVWTIDNLAVTTAKINTLAVTDAKINDISAPKVTTDTTHRFVTDAQITAWNAMLTGVIYLGVWNATTNTPALASGVGTAGHYYIVSVGGSTNLDGITTWVVGDWAIFNGTTWNKVDNTDAVSSVNGLTGAVSLDSSNVPDTLNKRYVTDADLVVLSNTSGTNTGDNAANTTSNAYADAKVADAINDGTTTIAPSQNAVFDALALKVTGNVAITGATKTKITYDSKGLVTSGTDATTSDIADSSNKRYVTDAQLVVIGNTSGTNSGNETTATLGATINAAASATPNDTDLTVSVESSVVKKNTWTQIKAFLKTYFDTIYATLISPSFTTPSLGDATATSINTGVTLNGKIFAKSTTQISLASTAHALTAGNEATDHNMVLGEYSTGTGIQSRNNGAIGALHFNPLGGDVRVGTTYAGVQNVTINNTDAGTGSYIELGLRNGATSADGLLIRTLGTGFTTSGANFQDGGVILTSTNLSGGLSIGTQASADLRLYTNNALRLTMAAATGNISTVGQVLSSGGGIGYTTGAGGTVTQITSRTTGVTNNKLCGTITMFSAAQAANALVTFTLTNSFIAATDFILVQHISATNGGAWNVSVVAGAGSATINIRNVSTASITEATPLRFTIIKAVTS